MSTAAQQNKPAAAAQTGVGMPQSEFERLLAKDVKSRIEFTPFGAQDKITLSVEIIRKYIAVPYRLDNGESAMPDDRQCMKFLMLCRSRALNPFEGDAFMIPFWNKSARGPEWSLIPSHQSFLKRAEIHPEYDGKRSGVIITPQRCKPCAGDGVVEGKLCEHCAGRGWYDELEGDYVPKDIGGEEVELRGGWCRVYFKGRKNPEYQRLRLATYAKNFGQWISDAAGMICKCAEAAALRSAFPTTLGGLYLREEMAGETGSAGFAKPDFGRAGSASPSAALEAAPGNEKPQLFQAPAEEEKLPDERQREPANEAANPPAAPAAADKPNQNTLLAVRNLCKMGNVKEGEVLTLLYEIGLSDGSVGTLDELAMTNPESLVKVYNQWADILARVKKVTGK